ncbi:DUF418 domain-containing protein [Corynebacterium aquatimens]|uniref:DUF418 domain-containing protein n=1 Tax=Corynebacterium TaxID=1716 RepID=UPI001F3D07EF|nr:MULTISPECIES: DUF418 domain-containing protein [Corynebacterium]QYH19767.1 DUF418 domain-containing protein [Corynebacterium aquatimens]UIZ93111.1 DUF418 domain-containing protein [Corynebacterium sp. CNCTC7651]
MTAPSSPQTPTRTVAKVRYIAPDVARGMALLGIALANTPTNWLVHADAPAAQFFGGAPEDMGLLTKILIVFQAMFVHVRGLPMFSTLLGVGIGMVTASLLRRGYSTKAARRALLRRYGFLLLFGLIHLLFFPGDILTGYGICGMITALLIGLSDRAILWIAGVVLFLWSGWTALGGTVLLTMGPTAFRFDYSLMLPANPETYAGQLEHSLNTLRSQPFLVPSILPMVLLGFVWGRSDLMGNVDKHARKLWVWVWVAVAVILLVGLPWGLAAVGVLPRELEIGLFLYNQAFGRLAGPGILAAVILALRPVQRRLAAAPGTPLPGWLAAFNALGKRSLSGYLGQTVLFFILTPLFMLGVGHSWGIGGQMLFATAVWLVTLFAAWAMERRGVPGPFEAVHRRLAYGKAGVPERFQPRELERA